MKLYNTLSRQLEEIKPLNDKNITLYSCGLTVYSQPHIGNWVAYIYWDILVRTLKASGYNVEHVQNITDVGHLTSDEDAGEDKMLVGALKEGKSAWDVAEKYIAIADHEAYGMLHLIRPSHMPRATEYIPQQIAFVKELEKKGFTYTIKDGVYFDTSKLANYGQLARLDIDGMRFGARVADTGKKNPTDFAVWKLSDPAEKRDMEWDSPWGKGFPGWHLECSVMAREILGSQIDIHTGGIDHIPVHHTNEIAQTEAITEKPFVSYWIHANHIKVEGTKMSKSLGNTYTLKDIIDKGLDIQAFKLLVLSKHFQTEGNFTWDILIASNNRLKNWQATADLRWQVIDKSDTDKLTADQAEIIMNATQQLLLALQNNLDTPLALSIIDEAFNAIEKTGLLKGNVKLFNNILVEIHNLLGINILKDDIDGTIKKLIIQRQAARDRHSWVQADEKRKQIKDLGFDVRDTPNGQIWSRI